MATPNPFQNLIISLTAGERIFTEGEVGTTMFIVQSGRVRLSRDSGGKPVTIAEMEKGDFFGEMSLLEATPRNMSADAIDSVELIEINSTTFDRMIRSNIEIAVRMLRKLSGRLQKAESLLGAQRAAMAGERDAAASLAAPALAPAPAAASLAAPRAARVPATAGVPAARAAAPARAVRVASPESIPLSPATPVAASARPAAATGSLSATRPPAGSPMAAAAALATTSVATPVALRPVTPAPPVTPVASPARPDQGQGARLVSESGDTVFPIAQGEGFVGRYDPVTETQPEVDLTLIDIKRSVSRRHARITLRDGLYYLTEEVGALNGTFVNGVKLTTGKPAPLSNEDRVSLGTVNLVFRS